MSQQAKEARRESAKEIREHLDALAGLLVDTPVKIPPRFHGAFEDFAKWFNTAYPKKA